MEKGTLQSDSGCSTVFLVRHGECEKNILDVHGGEGSKLTPNGQEQCKNLARFLRESEKLCRQTSVVNYHSVFQVRESARIICNENRYVSQCDEDLKGIYLGVLAGLSRKKALELYPEASSRMELWRKGKISPLDLKIPNAEDDHSFYRRILRFLERSIFNSAFQTAVVVGTNSTLIMITNIMLMGSDFSFKKYINRVFDCASATKFVRANSKYDMIYQNLKEHLNEQDIRPHTN